MSLSVVNLVLNSAGIVGDLNVFGGITRNLTFFDQENVLANYDGGALNLSVEEQISDRAGARIFYGIPFYHAAPLELSIDQNSKMCEQPVENGSLITEHKIRLPKRITCSMAMPNFLAGKVINEMQKYYNESKKIIIQSVSGVFMNMVLESMPTRINANNVDRPIYDVTFKEVFIIEPQDSMSSTNPADSDTKKVSVTSDILNNALSNNVMSVLGKVF
jgi:hypothetical protein